MSLFTRGTAPKALRIGTEHVLRAWLGDVLIWDGTVPAQVQVPRALASAAAVVPVVSSTPSAIAPPAAAASAAGVAPALSHSSSLVAAVATAASGGPAAAVSADAVVFAPTATSSASAVPILSDANVSAPTAAATAEALVPIIETTGSTIVVPPAAAALADGPVPIVSASKSVTAPTATASAAAVGTGVSIGLPVPAATASATAVAPAVTAMNFQPSGMTKNGSVAWAGSATWVTITNWTANTGTYPGSSVDGSHRLVVQGSKTNASISGQAAYTGGGFARTHSIRVVDQAGNVIATGAPNTNTSGNCVVSATGVDLTGVTALALQMSGDFSAGTLSSGASTFLTVT